jgi:hypothetical protein
VDELRRRAEDADELRAEQEGLRTEYQDVLDERDRLREEAQVLRARAAEADDLRDRLERAGPPEAAPDVARLRAELENVERERTELRAQLDATTQRLEDATQAMPPADLDGEERRVDRPRRPAQRTAAKRAAEPTATLSDKVGDWVGSLTGGHEDDQGSKNGERQTAAPAPAPRRTRAAAGTRTAPRRRRESPSWGVRVAALGLLAFLLVTLVVILSSIL